MKTTFIDSETHLPIAHHSAFTVSLGQSIERIPDRSSGTLPHVDDDDNENDEDDGSEELETKLGAVSYERDVEPLLSRLPPREADLIDLYYHRGVRQAELGQLFGVTQAAISYRLERAHVRLRFLLAIPKVTEEDMHRDLAFLGAIDFEIFTRMMRTTCQSVVAREMDFTQGRIRHRYVRIMEKLGKAAQEKPALQPYATLARMIWEAGPVLHEVILPQWKDRE